MRYKIVVLIVFCAAVVAGVAGPGTNVEARVNSLDAKFEAAATEYGVPKDLLLAMGYVNTRWEMPPQGASSYEEKGAGEKSPEARGSYGIMQLVQNPSRDTLGEAARLIGVSEERLKTDRVENIRGGAAVLAGLQGDDQPEDLGGWYETVAGYGGGPAYAEQVYKALEKGALERTSSGEQVRLAAREVAAPRWAETARAARSAGEYSGSTWYGASGYNYTAASRPSSNPIDKIVIHVMQGSWSSAINWFKDPAAGASAHYSVRSSDGFIGQSVAEKDIGYHAGNWPYNQTSIGIEHEGFVEYPNQWFTDTMYRSSARLSAYLAKKYDIPVDRAHIIGHNEVPYPNDHYDPGSGWDWNKYMGYVRQYASEGSPSPAPPPPNTTAYSKKIDNAKAKRFSAGSNWGRSSYSSQRYKADYRFARPGASYSAASFKVKTPVADDYAVYGWWPADPGYNDRTVFWIYTTSGWVSKTVNQSKNGGKWVYLGAYRMGAWDDWNVEVSNQSSGSGYIIADAIKVVQQ